MLATMLLIKRAAKLFLVRRRTSGNHDQLVNIISCGQQPSQQSITDRVCLYLLINGYTYRFVH
jgi:hypothetical protein